MQNDETYAKPFSGSLKTVFIKQDRTNKMTATAGRGIIQTLWADTSKRLPCTDCIVFADDTVTILKFEMFCDPRTSQRSASISPLFDTTLHSMLQYDADLWIDVDAWSGAQCTYQGCRYIGGAGTLGADGFVACEDLCGCLQWAMFFTQTNPFVELTIENPYLLAHTEHGEACLKINLNDIADMVYVTTEAA